MEQLRNMFIDSILQQLHLRQSIPTQKLNEMREILKKDINIFECKLTIPRHYLTYYVVVYLVEHMKIVEGFKSKADADLSSLTAQVEAM